MIQFYKIAGLNVLMDTFGRTEEQSRPYLVDGFACPDITVQSNWEKWKKRSSLIPDNECEYLATGDSFYTQMLNFDGMMIHSSAVVMNGKAFLFSAPCGTGKSTHTSLWRRTFGDNCVRILNDDKPALRYEGGTWYAYGTPWCGKTGQNLNIRVELAGIAILERGLKNKIERIGVVEALPMIMSQTVRPADKLLRIKQLELLDKLITNIPIWKLKCNMDPEASIVAYEAMSGNKFVRDNNEN